MHLIQNDAVPGGINNRKLHSYSQLLTHIAGKLYFGNMIKHVSGHCDLFANKCVKCIDRVISMSSKLIV